MNEPPHEPSDLDRRAFIRMVGGAALLSSLPVELAAAPGGAGPSTLALVGCAHIHTPGYVKLLADNRARARVKHVWDPNPERSRKWAPQLEASLAASPEAIFSDPEVGAVVVCSETNRHRELVLAAAAAGKHLYVEKPLGVNGREAREMAVAVSAAKLLFTTGYFMRTTPHLLFLKDQVEKGAFGKITRIAASNCHNGSLAGWFDPKPDQPWADANWMANPKVAGVGAFGDMGTHILDLAMWLCGDVRSVAAQTRVVTGRYGDCDEMGDGLFIFTSGVLGTLAAGWVDVANPVTLQISGTEGNAFISGPNLFFKCARVPGADGRQPWTDLPAGLPTPLQQFIDALGGQAAPSLVSIHEAAARVAVMEAAYASAARTSVVDVV
jgi:predicted dehydrogenase